MNEEQQQGTRNDLPVQPEQPTAQPRHNHSKAPLVFTAVIVLLGIGLGIGWLLFGKNGTSTTQNSKILTNQTAQTPSAQTTLQPSDITAKIKQTLATQYALIDIGSTDQQQGQLKVGINQTSPPYKVTGYPYYIDYPGGSTLSAVTYYSTSTTTMFPTTADESVRSQIATMYTDFGLVKSSSTGNVSQGNATDLYRGKGLICTVETPASASSSITASCGALSAYPAAAAAIKPFATALTGLTASTVLDNLRITASSVAGYKTAQLGEGDINGGGSVALFYKKDSGTWTYFKNTQQELLCSDYSTPDLRSAFKDQTCISDPTTGQQATVQ